MSKKVWPLNEAGPRHNAPRRSVWAPQIESFFASALTRRIVSGIVMAASAVLVGWVGGWLFAVFAAALLAVMGFEWSRLVNCRVRWDATAVIVVPAVAATFATLVFGPTVAAGVTLVGIVIAAAYSAVRAGQPVWHALGVVYLCLPAMSVIWLRSDMAEGRWLLLYLFFVVWAADSGAYLVGKLVGGPKLTPQLSPGKTWAGLVGALAFGGAVALATAFLADFDPLLHFLFLGILIALVSQLGDLVESAVKRRFKAKDASGFIPGHGGVMDRLDGLVFAAVALALVHWNITLN